MNLSAGHCPKPYSPECVEKKEEFSEVRGSKLPHSGRALAHRGGAVRGFWCQSAPRWPHSWRGIVASGCDLLRANYPENFSKKPDQRYASPVQCIRVGRSQQGAAQPVVKGLALRMRAGCYRELPRTPLLRCWVNSLLSLPQGGPRR